MTDATDPGDAPRHVSARVRELNARAEDERSLRQHAAAAATYSEAAALVASDPPRHRYFVMRQAAALVALGRDRDDEPALLEAVALLGVAENAVPRSADQVRWAEIRKRLGDAYFLLGYRDPTGTTLLERALACQDEALAEFGPLLTPGHWVYAQLARAKTLIALGTREKRVERLEAAGDTCHAALEVVRVEPAPAAWYGATEFDATARLVTSLMVLEKLEPVAGRLESAIALCQRTCEVHSRAWHPVPWAAMQSAIGDMLTTLGMREGGTRRLGEAERTLRAALAVRPPPWLRKMEPDLWALTACRLGVALKALGERTSRTQHLEEAVSLMEQGLSCPTSVEKSQLRQQILPVLEEARRCLQDRTATRYS